MSDTDGLRKDSSPQPLYLRSGGAVINKNIAEPPDGADGVVLAKKMFGC